MIDLVRKRHDGDGWIIFSELANASGFHAKRYADAAALGVWASTKYELHLYEFKISREDLKRELRDPTKAEGVGKYAHYWWLVVSDESVIKDLVIPDVWGIIMPKKHGDTRRPLIIRKAPRISKPQPFGPLFCISMIRNIASKWVKPDKHSEVVEELYKIKNGPPPTDEEIEKGQTVYDLERKLDALQKNIDRFEAASGVSISESWNGKRIGDAFKVALEMGDLGGVNHRRDIHRLSETAREYEQAAKGIAEKAAKLRTLCAVTDHADTCQTKRGWGGGCSCGAVPLSNVEKSLSEVTNG